jgi:hypothetical protein
MWPHFWGHDAKRQKVGDVRKGDATYRSANRSGCSGIVGKDGRE